MKLRNRIAAVSAGVASAALLALSGQASAAFPDYAGCPSGVFYCIDIQSTSGSMDIKGFGVPLGDSLRIRGGLGQNTAGEIVFSPARGTNGFIAKPVQVPGGILGIDFWLPGNSVTATAQLAGSPSDIRLNPFTLDMSVPLKLALTNPIIGPGCQIGSNRSPVWVNLITGTTAPPAPNRPISGHLGRLSTPTPTSVILSDNLNVDNSFAIPGASGCGIGLGLINGAINLKLKLPSAAGNNALIVGNNVALAQP
ncbi:hypothetical protein VSS74_04140 [Conexibacter stalactiti]|uniref:Secreted protein n=1 Tax=Conexibacter stalactiti TaxID=1940611 RepID=A0ABU4HJM1_9ACTN|nr:hypothetical protein [Conexibacter stalactiti]MDW5593513.1 hypothetical protein [Conexibacter stalactiti]MEC5034154.1 hypothetical protein [Conexibacter stalactiti]